MRRILIIDDEKDIAEGLHELLEARGFDVETAGTENEAEAIYKTRGPFDLILTDPTGLEFVRAVKKSNPSQAIGFMSGYSGKVEEVQNEFNFALAKPFDLAGFLQLIKQAVSG